MGITAVEHQRGDIDHILTNLKETLEELSHK
jgi:hypothetical protein